MTLPLTPEVVSFFFALQMLLDGNCCWTAIADSLFQIELPNGTEKPAHFAMQLARLLVVAMKTVVASMRLQIKTIIFP